MIKIERDKKELIIKIDTRRGWEVWFKRSSDEELSAILLKEHLEELFANRIETIRRDAYERGWKDKSAHKAKRIWFSRCINNDL